jgi:predicted XRE-type DNA-binding protein
MRRSTDPVLEALTAAGIAWALDDGRYAVDGRQGLVPVTDPPSVRRRRDLCAALALILAERGGLTQREIAAVLRVSQPRVHRLVHELRARGVDRTSIGALAAAWERGGHAPQGEVQHWVADGAAWQQVAQACDRLEVAGHVPVVGGEPAADHLVAWMTPATAVVHARGLRPLGPPFVPVAVSEEATLTVEATRDPLVHALAAEAVTPAGRRRVAHPAIVARDLRSTAGANDRVAEVVDRLRRWPAWRMSADAAR